MAIEKYIMTNHAEIDYKRSLLRATLKRGLESGWLAPHHQHANSCTLLWSAQQLPVACVR